MFRSQLVLGNTILKGRTRCSRFLKIPASLLEKQATLRSTLPLTWVNLSMPSKSSGADGLLVAPRKLIDGTIKCTLQSYPAAFLPCCWNPGTYVNGSGSASFYNLGQIFLNNAFTFVFCDWRRSDITMELTNRNAPGSHETPIFTNPAAWPTRARLVQHLLRGSKDPKYGGLIHHVLSQARAANDGIGPCRKALLFVCGELSRKENNNPAWHNSELGQWFRGYAKTRGIPMGPGPVNVPINFCGACCQTPLTPRMGGFGSPVVHR